MPRALPRDRSAPIMVPECEAAKMRPTGRSGSSKAALAVISAFERRSTTPRLEGPTTRMPVAAQISRRRVTRAAPMSPASVKPSASSVATLTPSRPDSATASTEASVGATT
jgi:hypothetical protein